jgi:hypothetical protein
MEELMSKTLAGLCTALLLATTVPAFTQSSRSGAQYDTKDTTISGCLEKNKSGGFWLTNAMVESAGAKSGVDTTTGTTGSATTTTSSGDKDVRPATANGLWNLENGKDLDRYLNQQIQVTGRAQNDTSGDELKGTSGHEQEARDFDVKSVTRLASSCR